MAGVKVEKKSQSSHSSQRSAPATAQRNKCKQPSIQRALRRANTLDALEAAPKRKRSGITPDSCGKAGDPHNLESGALAACPGHIAKKRRRALDEGWDGAAQEAGNSNTHPVNVGLTHPAACLAWPTPSARRCANSVLTVDLF